MGTRTKPSASNPTDVVSSQNLTQSDMVLVSMVRLAKGKTERVPYEEIVLQAWRDFPEAFSLRSHPEHPDASDIHKKIYQTLKPAGYVLSLGNKVFRLTDKGVARGQTLLASYRGESGTSEVDTGRLSRSEQTFYHHAVQSRAYSVWKDGDRSRLIDHDVRLFFQFSTGTPFRDRRQKAEFAREGLQKAGALGLEHSDALLQLSDFLTDEFATLFEGA